MASASAAAAEGEVEIERPLMEEEEDSLSSSSSWVVVVSTAVAVFGSFEFGCSVGYSSPAQSGIMQNLNLSLSEYSIFGSILTIGAMIGAIASGHIADAMAVSDLFCIVGWLFIALTKELWWLDVGRLSTGFGIGLHSYMAKVGQHSKFEAALQSLRGKDIDISQEAEEIKEFTESLQHFSQTSMLDLFQKKYLHSVIVGVGLMVFQQFGGVNAICFYASEIFVSAGFSSGKTGTILMAVVQVPMTAIGVLLLEKTGRKPLLRVSAAGTCVGSFLVGLSFLLQEHEGLKELNTILALTGILVFTGSFSLGMGGIPWIIMSEVPSLFMPAFVVLLFYLWKGYYKRLKGEL
ncbi:sugar transporter ERD6-like 5 [Cocos nucifera]|uniref:Sugar transporter ERD6-like 5 n=1 Tax=Cocos nucifera TaxID=13894 RepID=A0A8K0HWC2_COCNU|nr:sugar transporter ERD6-like 5 [Cocos nucifera]